MEEALPPWGRRQCSMGGNFLMDSLLLIILIPFLFTAWLVIAFVAPTLRLAYMFWKELRELDKIKLEELE